MDSNDQPVEPVDEGITAPTAPDATAPRPSGFRRTVLTAGMAAALLVAGGAAAVSAASPDPSDGTTSPSTTQSGQDTRANCHDATGGTPSATPSATPTSAS
jgi:ferric-dicitrate binding protein FerR (iron transport regulator)